MTGVAPDRGNPHREGSTEFSHPMSDVTMADDEQVLAGKVQ